MSNVSQVNRPAPLKNVAAFSELISKVVNRNASLPGLACFYGPSGLGKTRSAIYGANRYRAAYVECGQLTTARSLLISILKEIGVQKPRGTATDMVDQAVEILATDRTRPLIIDEAHNIAHKRFVDLVRELHDKSLAPIILIGEETLPKHLEGFERVHNRMLDWVAAVPCDADDFGLLRVSVCPKVEIAPDLTAAILEKTRGNTRRIIVNLARAAEIADRDGSNAIGLEAFGGMGGIVGLSAPTPRKGA